MLLLLAVCMTAKHVDSDTTPIISVDTREFLGYYLHVASIRVQQLISPTYSTRGRSHPQAKRNACVTGPPCISTSSLERLLHPPSINQQTTDHDDYCTDELPPSTCLPDNKYLQ